MIRGMGYRTVTQEVLPMVQILTLAAVYAASIVGLIAFGYWWGYGNGQADADEEYQCLK